MKKTLKKIGLPVMTVLGVMLTTPAYGANIQQYIDSVKKNTVTKNAEREKLENIVLENIAKNQVAMFGEDHESRIDNDFVAGFLPKLKEQGFEYLALEIEKNPSTLGNKILKDYAHGKITREDIKPSFIRHIEQYAPGWLDFIDAIRKAELKIVCYQPSRTEYNSFNEYEEIAFDNLKGLIFNKNPDAKVIIYCGASHLNEKELYDPETTKWEIDNGLTSKDKKHRCLAFHINRFTKDKTFTVSMYPDSNIPHCDLTIDLDNSKYNIKTTSASTQTVNQKNWKGLEDIVLENSAKNQVVMFGEEHFLFRLDSDFVANLLPKLKEQGFEYFAIEIDRNPIQGSIQGRVMKILSDYANGKITREDIHPSLKAIIGYTDPGWLDLIDVAKKAKLKIVCYDAGTESQTYNARDKASFNNLKELIFDKEPKAKVVVYCGEGHVSEKPTLYEDEEIQFLGFYLNEYTCSKNFTVSLSRRSLEPLYCDLKLDLTNNKIIK